MGTEMDFLVCVVRIIASVIFYTFYGTQLYFEMETPLEKHMAVN